VVIDGRGSAFAVNRRWSELTGRTEEGSLGKGWLAALGPTGQDQVLHAIAHLVSAGGPVQFDCRLGGADSTGDDGTWTRWWGQRHDLHDRHVIAFAVADVDRDYRRRSDLYDRATRDPLTGLVNRSLFLESVERSLDRARRTGEVVGVLYIDLDGFKSVNDRAGHRVGDEALVLAAGRLRHSARGSDVVARIGGDEFAVLCNGLDSAERIKQVADRFERMLSEEMEAGGRKWTIRASIGAAVADSGQLSAEDLLNTADVNMYAAKGSRRAEAR
jgi:diguanylate cyclase (GGDEF)-like protein